MLVLSLPALPADGAGFRSAFNSKWGHVNGRTIAVDDDNFLILNHGQIYSTSIRAAHPVEVLAIRARTRNSAAA